MMGRLKNDQGQLFYEFRLGDAIPEDHLVRKSHYSSMRVAMQRRTFMKLVGAAATAFPLEALAQNRAGPHRAPCERFSYIALYAESSQAIKQGLLDFGLVEG